MSHLKKILFLAFLVFGLNLFAQTDTIKFSKLKLTIIDSITKKPIEFATIKLEAKDFIKIKYSDKDGEIVIDSLEHKSYKLSVMYTGYFKQIFENFKIDSGVIIFKKIVLQQNKNFVFKTICKPPLIKKDEPTQQNFNNKQIMRMPY